MGKDLTVIVKHTTATNKEKLRGVEGGVGAEEKRNRAKGWGEGGKGGGGGIVINMVRHTKGQQQQEQQLILHHSV